MALIERVPNRHFSGGRRITDDHGRALVPILNELIDCVNAIGPGGNSKIATTFDFSDVSGGSVAIGTIDAGAVVSEVAVLIGAVFDGGVGITIGTATAQALLMLQAENAPSVAETYKKDVDLTFAVAETVSVYFPVGAPTEGIGAVIVYLA